MLTVNPVNFKSVNLTLILYNYKRKSGAILVPQKDRLHLPLAMPGSDPRCTSGHADCCRIKDMSFDFSDQCKVDLQFRRIPPQTRSLMC